MATKNEIIQKLQAVAVMLEAGAASKPRLARIGDINELRTEAEAGCDIETTAAAKLRKTIKDLESL